MRIVVHLITLKRRTGAFITTLDLAQALQERGHEVLLNPPAGTTGDVTISHLGDPFARVVKGPHFLMVHGANLRYRRRLPGYTRVWFPSDNLAGWYLRPRNRVVLPPPINPADYKVRKGKHVTLAQATRGKGSVQLRKFALALPEIPFLAVQAGLVRPDPVLAGIKNVEIVPRFDDARHMLRRTRVLVMPLGGMSWGRTAVEASVSGIPTIATGLGGVREAMLGEGATYVSYADPKGWIEAIRHVWGEGFTEASDRARARGEALDYAGDVDRLCRAVEETA